MIIKRLCKPLTGLLTIALLYSFSPQTQAQSNSFTIQAEDYQRYHDTSNGNTGGAYRNDNVDIQASTDTGGGFNVGWIASGEWLEYDINLAESGQYNGTFRVASDFDSGAFQLYIDGAEVGKEFIVPNTGGWQAYRDISQNLGQLSAGTHTLRVAMTGSSFNINWMTFSHQASSSGAAIPGTIQAEDYIRYHDNSAGNNGDAYRQDDVDIETTTDHGGGYNVGWIRQGEWLEYDVNVEETGDYRVVFRVASGQSSGNFALEIDGNTVVDSQSVSNTGGWQSWQDLSHFIGHLSEGPHTIRLTANGDDFNLNWLRFESSATQTGIHVPGIIQAEDYERYYDSSSGNNGSVFRFDDVDIEPTSDAGGGYNVGWVDSGEWLEYDIIVDETSNYSASFRFASLHGGGGMRIELDGHVLGQSFSLPSTGGWQNWDEHTQYLGRIEAGEHRLRIKVNTDGFNLNWFSLNGGASPGSERRFDGGVESNPLFHWSHRPIHRIPGIIKTGSGRIIVGVETRETWSDHADKEVVISMSDDGGRTWHSQQVMGDNNRDTAGNPTFIYDREADRVILFYATYVGSEGNPSYRRVFYRYSDSDGTSWSAAHEVTHLFPGSYSLVLPGPGHGIQMQNSHKGRLILPFWGYKNSHSTIGGLYSDDHGESWRFGYESSGSDNAYGPNEHQVIEQDNGNLLIIARTAITDTEFGAGMVRAKAISTNGGKSIGPLLHSSQFSGPVVMGSVIRMPDRLLYSSPLNPNGRDDLGIRESFTNGQNWEHPTQFTSGFSAYSDMVALDRDTFGIVYEVNNYKDFTFRTIDISQLNTNVAKIQDNSPTNSNVVLGRTKQSEWGHIVDDGRFGRAVNFDGNSHLYIEKTPDNVLGNGDFSLNLWYRSYFDFSGQEALFWFFTLGSGHDAMWTRFYDNNMRVLVNSGNTEEWFDRGTGTIGTFDWHMMTIVRRGDTLDFYLDGVRYRSMPGYFSPGNFGDHTDFGYFFGARPNNKSSTGYSEGFHGAMDEIKIYRRALSQSEINTLRSNGDVNRTGLVIDLPF